MTNERNEPPFNCGDRVWLILPTGLRRPHLTQRRYTGTVANVSDRSLRIDLDEPCNGITWCTATKRETHHVD